MILMALGCHGKGVKNLQESDALPLPKCSSQQHLQAACRREDLCLDDVDS
jgi:hypothetical protein